MKQRTLAGEATLSGIGLHGGAESSVTLKPGPEGSGAVFVRSDLAGRPEIPARIEFAAGADRGTTLSRGGTTISTVEHVLSALAGMGVDNCRLEVTGAEPPEVDGSALPFVAAIRRAGIVEQEADRAVPYLSAPVWIHDGDGRYAAASPAAAPSVAYTLEYRQPYPIAQFASFALTPEVYEREIAPARTFCFHSEIEALRSAGLIKGGSAANAVVFGPDGRPSSPLRFDNEPARHKIVDLVGDLFLAGGALSACVVACRTGHAVNQRLARALASAVPAFSGPPFPTTDPGLLSALAAKGALDGGELRQVIPHRHPFLLVDRIVELTPDSRAVGLLDVTPDLEFFRGHFPGEPVMPGVLIVEALAQVGAVLVLSRPENAGKLAFFAAIREARFRRPVRPGDRLRLEVELLRLRGKVGTARAVARVGDEVACDGEIWFALVDRGTAS